MLFDRHNTVAVDQLSRIDADAHKRKASETFPVFSYETELKTMLTPGACQSMGTFVGGKGFQAVVLVIGASRILPPQTADDEYSLMLQDETSYGQVLEELLKYKCIDGVPVLVLLNGMNTLRAEGQSDDDFNKLIRGICNEVKLALSLVEDKVSDLGVIGCDDSDESSISEGITWLVRKLRAVVVK